ncbi:MAG: flagellar basal body P-ring protein FlgI [bacterium]
MIHNKYLILLIILILWIPLKAHGTRIKDIASIDGVRENQLLGYGLVVGLNGTGDKGKTAFTIRSLVNMLNQMGISVTADEIKVKNVAAVIVTATLPPFAKNGTRIDITVSSLGDAASLQGGTLLLTPLKGPDGVVYAVAQGAVSVGGFSVGGGGGGSVQKNHPTVGRISDGALIERELNLTINPDEPLKIRLHQPDFITAIRIVKAITAHIGESIETHAIDPSTIELSMPPDFDNNVIELVATIENIEIIPDTRAKVILNERTGTVVVGENVRISNVAIAHGNLSIEIKKKPQVSQPPPLSQGETVYAEDTIITSTEEKAELMLVPAGVTIQEVVNALNAIGVSSRDLISIFQSLKAANALHADLEIL